MVELNFHCSLDVNIGIGAVPVTHLGHEKYGYFTYRDLLEGKTIFFWY